MIIVGPKLAAYSLNDLNFVASADILLCISFLTALSPLEIDAVRDVCAADMAFLIALSLAEILVVREVCTEDICFLDLATSASKASIRPWEALR